MATDGLTVETTGRTLRIAVEAGTPPSLDVATEAAVAAIWEAERKRRGDALFNGRVLSLVAQEGELLWVRVVEYRAVLAQRLRPTLFATLGIRPLAVSGLLTCADGIVFGRRGGRVTEGPGQWELVPSGGLDADAIHDGGVDPVHQILVELHEEVGIAAAEVGRVEAFCLVEDGTSHLIDIGFRIDTPLPGSAVQARHRERVTGEYTDIAVVAKDAIEAFLGGAGASLLPVSRKLLAAAEIFQ